jgi:uncharacterized protein (TIGR03435 family)
MLRPIAIPLALIPAFSFCLAQEAKPEFEVVSIRPGSDKPVVVNGMAIVGAMQGGPGSSDPERLTGNSVALRDLVLRAYGVNLHQLSGPGWIETTRYDVNAKIPPGTTRDEFKLMLQGMLEDRFKLKLHHETRDVRAYNLVVAKGGLKLRDFVSTDACSAGNRPVGGTCREGAVYQSGIMKSAGTERSLLSLSPPGPSRIISGSATQLSVLARMLEPALGGSIVADKTGLTDKFNLRFEFASPTFTGQDDTPLPTLFMALEDAGLKLESVRTSLDVLVIDHIERPSEN